MNVTPRVLTTKQSERDAYRRNGTFIGGILLAMLGAQQIVQLFNLILVSVGFLKANEPLFGLSNTAYCVLKMLWYVLYIPAPALVVGILTRSRMSPFPVKRMPISDTVAMALVGMAFAVLANIATSWLMVVLEQAGVPIPTFPDTVEPTTQSLWLNILSTAVFPALAEEMVFRAYVQGALRSCGTTASVVLSALLFSLFHGNILQVPFAFLMGLILGWLFASTGSILPSVLLHFGNNLMAVLTEYLSVRYPDLKDGGTVILLFATVLLGGAIGLAVLLSRKRSAVWIPPGNGVSSLSKLGRITAPFTSPALLCATVWLVAQLVVSML